MDAIRDCFTRLPNDYSNWSSAVIFFKERDEEISAYLFDSDNGVMYTVMHFPRPKHLYGKLGYAAGSLFLFFVGLVTSDEEGFNEDSRQIRAYHIPSRTCIEFPELNTPKPAPFVFYLKHNLFVLSSLLEQVKSHFEKLEIGYHQWEQLPEPSFVENNYWACHHSYIIDSEGLEFDSEEEKATMLYVRLVSHTNVSCKAELYGFPPFTTTFSALSWKKYNRDSELSPRTRNLLKASWSSDSVIVGNFLYTFRMFQYLEGLRATLVIRDLEHDIQVDNNEVEPDFVDVIHNDSDPPFAGTQEVNISNIVPDVLHDLYAAGSLVYLGEKNSRSRFSLVVSYNCKSCSGNKHVYPCTFDVDNQANVVSVCSLPGNHTNVGRGRLSCHKLCGVGEDLSVLLQLIR